MENRIISIKNFFRIFQQRLSGQFDEKEIDQFLYILCERYLGWGKPDVHQRSDEVLSAKKAGSFYHALSELSRNRPIQYITGIAYFSGLELSVNPDVLIPRPETEELVDLVMKDNRQRKDESLTILDIGTGSGCIAVSLNVKLLNAVVTAIDVSSSGLMVASENAKRYGCLIRFHRSDILDPVDMENFPAYHIIVSNPPYVLESERELMRPNVLDHEPAAALFVPDHDPMRFNQAIAGFALHHLVRPGNLYLEINERFGRQVSELLYKMGFQNIEVIRDLRHKDRFVKAILPDRLS